jgi:glycosyltransferase involved in cell wall biosynthesis
MKIVIAALSAPEHLNGVSRHAANVVRGLLTRTEASEIHMLVGAWQQQAFEQAVARGDSRLHIHPISVGRGLFSRNLWYYSELPRIAMQLDADVVHLAYPVPVSSGAFHCPVVVSLHDLYPYDMPENFGFPKSVFNRLVVRQCLRLADAIACVSESTRGRLGHWLGKDFADRAVTILNAVEPVSVACAKGPPAMRRCRSFFLCIAQHRRNKNIALALEIFDLVLRSGIVCSEMALVIIGVPGPETTLIERQIRKLRLERQVVLLSGITDSELQWCYRNCKLLLAPSIVEGFGLPVAEALLAGCRVVCSDIPAFREVGREACRYVALGQGQLDGFTEAVREALGACRLAPSSMPWLEVDAVAEKYILLYRRLLSCHVRPGYRTLPASPIGGPSGL